MFDLILIAAVQIILESLPISSSGHQLLVQQLWIKVTGQALTPIPDFFDHFLHGPTVLVIAFVFFKDWFASARRLVIAGWKVLVHRKQLRWSERRLWRLFSMIFIFMCAADAMTVLAYVGQHFIGKNAVIFHEPRFLLMNMMATMVALLSLRWVERVRRAASSLTLKKSLLLGTVQGVALLCPGLSRFGATYVAGRWLRLSPRRAFQFSFLIQFPLIAAAFFINGIPDMVKTPAARALLSVPMLMTIAVSTVIALGLFAWAYRLALRRRLWWFGVYMIVPISILVWLVMR